MLGRDKKAHQVTSRQAQWLLGDDKKDPKKAEKERKKAEAKAKKERDDLVRLESKRKCSSCGESLGAGNTGTVQWRRGRPFHASC